MNNTVWIVVALVVVGLGYLIFKPTKLKNKFPANRDAVHDED